MLHAFNVCLYMGTVSPINSESKLNQIVNFLVISQADMQPTNLIGQLEDTNPQEQHQQSCSHNKVVHCTSDIPIAPS